MLIEVSCEKFIDNGKVRPKIEFHPGLNTVMGARKATNSIGKTTFLLIIDYSFPKEPPKILSKSNVSLHIHI